MKLGALAAGVLVGAALLIAPSHLRAESLPVEVAYLPLLGSAQLFVMEDEGWTKEAGLDLKLTRFSSGAAIVQALASGKFDVAIMAMSPVIVARAAGVDLKVVAAMHDKESHAFMGAAPLVAAYAETESPAAAFAKFHKDHGHPVRIATLPKGTLPDSAIRYYIEQNKIDPADYQILSQGAEQVLQSILADAVEAISLAEPLMTVIAEKKPGAKVLAYGKGLMPGHPGFVFSVREKFIASHPDAVKKLVEMNKRATKLIESDPKRAGKAALSFIGRGLLDDDLMTAAISSKYNPVASDPKALVAGTELMQDFQVKIGVQARKVPSEELFDLQFAD